MQRLPDHCYTTFIPLGGAYEKQMKSSPEGSRLEGTGILRVRVLKMYLKTFFGKKLQKLSYSKTFKAVCLCFFFFFNLLPSFHPSMKLSDKRSGSQPGLFLWSVCRSEICNHNPLRLIRDNNESVLNVTRGKCVKMILALDYLHILDFFLAESK